MKLQSFAIIGLLLGGSSLIASAQDRAINEVEVVVGELEGPIGENEREVLGDGGGTGRINGSFGEAGPRPTMQEVLEQLISSGQFRLLAYSILNVPNREEFMVQIPNYPSEKRTLDVTIGATRVQGTATDLSVKARVRPLGGKVGAMWKIHSRHFMIISCDLQSLRDHESRSVPPVRSKRQKLLVLLVHPRGWVKK